MMFTTTAIVLLDAKAQALSRVERQVNDTLVNLHQSGRDFNTDPSAVLGATKARETIRGKLSANKNAAPPAEHFQSVGHSLFALLAGLLGGMTAIWFYARRENT